MVDAAKNNDRMKLPKLNIGVVYPPRSIHRPILADERVAIQRARLAQDQFEKQTKDHDFLGKQKTPTGIIVGVGAILTGLLLLKVKPISKVKNLINSF